MVVLVNFSPAAMFAYGVMLNGGALHAQRLGGRIPVSAEAEAWIRRSAEAGHIPAMKFLAEHVDDAWLARAAEAGDPESMLFYGWCFRGHGAGIPRPGYPIDHAKAMEWTRRSAEAGYRDAQADLGAWLAGSGADLDRLRAEWGIAVDEPEGAKWLVLAAAQGSKDAEDDLRELLRRRPDLTGER